MKIKLDELPKLESYNSNYGSTRSFEDQEFKEFQPLSRTVSCTTFQDFDFCDENKQYEKAENRLHQGTKPRVKIILPEEKKDGSEFPVRTNAFGCTTSFRKNMFISNPNSRRASVTGVGSGLT